MIRKVFFLIVALPGILSLLSCTPAKEKLYKKNRIAMDTFITITVASSSGRDAEKAMDRAFAAIERLGGLFNYFDEGSEVSLINRNAGIRPVVVSQETLDIIEQALSVSRETDGAFDITIGPVMALWDFHKGVLPDAQAVKDRLQLVGYRKVVVDKAKGTVFLRKKGMQIDLGGIAKGYAADRAVEILRKNGMRAGLVAVAGDIKAYGLKPDRSAWRIGLKAPRERSDGQEIFASLPLRERAVSTSGDYERFFIRSGVRYHHLLDPKTGYPASGCRSVSVIAGEGTLTDAFSTGVFVLGPERGMETLKRLGFDGVIVDSSGAVSLTEGIKGSIELDGKKS
ncbi:MAG: FAD:protein FMN transferase [Thermodesulfovibrionales bacterium]